MSLQTLMDVMCPVVTKFRTNLLQRTVKRAEERVMHGVPLVRREVHD